MNNPLPFVYNPREASREVLEAMLVGRDEILRELQNDLLAQTKSATRQHWLIRGPRGIGKTHLVAILYHRIRQNAELSSGLLPVWLGEAEAYDAYSAGMLLLAIANRLVEELPDEAGAGLRTAIAGIQYGGDDPALFNDLCELLKREARSRGKILVVLMENLDAWLDSISGQKGRVEAGRLRSLLSDDKEFLFISTTPTHYLPKLSRPGSPLFGHLRERRLQPLSESQLRELFDRLKRLTGRDVAVEDDPHRPETRLRWRVLHRLAGGNPRAGVMAFSIITGAPGLRAMVDELARLLDAQTAYYEARLARLAPRERAIVKALALSRTNLTISQIAVSARLPERSLSTQVKRLLDEGHIVLAGDQKGKGAIFELTDGLFRTWHHYRYGRQMLEPLVRFLALFHTPQDLKNTLEALAGELVAPRSALERDLTESTALQIRSALEYASSPVGCAERDRLWAECERELVSDDVRELYRYIEELQGAGRVSNPPSAFACAERIVARFRQGIQRTSPPVVVDASIDAAGVYSHTGHPEKAITVLREVIDALGDPAEPALREQVARAMVNLAVTLAQSGRTGEELATYRDVIERFGNSAEPVLWEGVARATLNLGAMLGRSGRTDEAMAMYRDIVVRFGDSAEPVLREGVARAMVNLGVTLRQTDRTEEAIATYRQVIARFVDSMVPVLRERVAFATFNLGVALGQSGQTEEEVKTYRDVIGRFGDSTEPALREYVAQAAFNLGVTLGQTGRREEEEATYRDVIARFGDSVDPALQEPVARAMTQLGVALRQSGRPEEAIATHRQVMARFGHSVEPLLQEQVASAMLNLGGTLAIGDRIEEAIATFRDVIARFDGATRILLRDAVGTAAVSLAVLLQGKDRHEEAVAVASRAVDIAVSLEGESGPTIAAVARLSLATSLNALGRVTEGRAVLADTVRQLVSAKTVPLKLVDHILTALIRYMPLPQAEELLREIIAGATPEITEMARPYQFVLDVLRAEEPASARVKLGPAARRKRVLARVPPELRETVIEKAKIFKQERAKLTKRSIHTTT